VFIGQITYTIYLVHWPTFLFIDSMQLDPNLPKYAKVEGLRGTLNAAGSDTMLELQTLMAEDFRKLYPQVKIQVEGKG